MPRGDGRVCTQSGGKDRSQVLAHLVPKDTISSSNIIPILIFP